MRIPFHKYEGLGNDFIVVDRDALSVERLSPAQVRGLCDRHRGIGADGLLIVDAVRPSMHVTNSDGSIPQMCGNGLRCAALHLARRKELSSLDLQVDTDSGPHRCVVEREASEGSVLVTMRPASLRPEDIPLLAAAPWVDAPLRVGERQVRVTAVSMGNPHAVTFDELGGERFALASQIQQDEHFPEGANVGFAQLKGGRTIELHVFERGAGWTQACGTGACAAAVAAVHTGRAAAGESLALILPGGSLSITVQGPTEPILMKGPARHVFSGEVTV